MSWENAAPLITAATPIMLFVLSVFLRTADQRNKNNGGAALPVKVESGAEVTPSPREQALMQDIQQEATIARLEERVKSLEAERDRLISAVARRDVKIQARDETIRELRG